MDKPVFTGYLRWCLALLVLAVAGCATNPYPAYYGYGPPPGSVTPTIPYTYAPNYGYGYYGTPYAYPAYYPGLDMLTGYGYGWYPGYWSGPRTIINVTPTVPSTVRSGPPPRVYPSAPPPPALRPLGPRMHMARPCVTQRTREGTTTVCP